MSDPNESPPSPAGLSASGKPRIKVAPIDQSPPGAGPVVSRGAINQVAVTCSVEVGRITMPFKAVRSIRHGEVIALDRPIDDPMDIRVNGMLIARGQIIATESRKFGIRVTEVVAADHEDQ